MMPSSLIAILLLTATATPQARAAQQLPPCLVGNFRYTSFESLVQNVLPEGSGSINVASGEALRSVQANGAFENSFRELTLAAVMGNTPYTMTFDGWQRGTVRESSPGRLTATTTAVSITVTISSQGISETATVNEPGEPTTVIDYECQGDRVITHATVQPTSEGPPAILRTETVRIN
jgi:hypothetical protein